MNALIKPLVNLAVLSVLTFAPSALAVLPCDQTCGESVPCDSECYVAWLGRTTCGKAGLECTSEPLEASQVSRTEQRSSSEESSLTCHAPKQAPESSAQPARS
ncbi:hypothetical protein [Archangium lipolyticum]|uniref:hypothetical protein n=1 Tax=Archangium lipolyticum TaxID=2970465 RepID=UPI002149AA94|nr:hypothetical protein [Archangium lipolyticum]